MEETAIDLDDPRFLVIEDEATQRDFLREVLRTSGYEVDVASDCSEGRASFVKGRYACVLVDLNLPDGHGEDLLSEFAAEDPELVALVLTGDSSAETIIGTMRAGAFDYLTKPVTIATLKASLARALSHHAVRKERTKLLELLLEERERLRARVEAATADIRQYAEVCEASNTRLRALLELTQLSRSYLSEDMLLRQAFDRLSERIPLRALALSDVYRQKMAAVYRLEGQPTSFKSADGTIEQSAYDPLLAQVEPEQAMSTWLERHAGVEVGPLTPHVFTQTFKDRATCSVGFYLAAGPEEDPALNEFLDMCAYFLAFEWEQGRLLLRVAHFASLGNIAAEVARSFIQPLTAIRTAAEVVSETIVSPEGAQGMAIVQENVERLRRQVQEFHKLTVLKEDSVETVRLDDFVDQALDILTVPMRNRNVTIDKDFRAEGECVLLNGAVLARTFLGLILGAVRSVEMGGTVTLRLRDMPREHIAFEVCHRGAYTESLDASSSPFVTDDARPGRGHPGLQLAERTVHMCGGSLAVERDADQQVTIRVVLPRNITNLPAVGGREARQ